MGIILYTTDVRVENRKMSLQLFIYIILLHYKKRYKRDRRLMSRAVVEVPLILQQSKRNKIMLRKNPLF